MMIGPLNELQLSLIAAGLVAVVGVWGYNIWQERKDRKLAQEVFSGGQSDVLMHQRVAGSAKSESSPNSANSAKPAETNPDNEMPEIQEPAQFVAVIVEDSATPSRTHRQAGIQERIEPVFHSNDETVVEAEDHPHVSLDEAARTEPASVNSPLAKVAMEKVSNLNSADSIEGIDERLMDSEPPLELADSLVDCIVSFNAADLISAPLFWSAQRQLMGRLAVRLRWSGLDENNGQWKLLNVQDSSSYRRLVAALQIADRSGPVNAADLMLFCNGVRQLAAHYQAQVVVPVEADVLAHALAIDEFCAAVDWRLGINLVPREGVGLSLVGLKQLADTAGLRLDDKGIFHVRDDAGRVLFAMSSLGGAPFVFDDAIASMTPGVTLTIDVPLVADGCAVFNRMLNFAHHMTAALDAVMVDDQRVRLSDEILAVIRIKVVDFQRKMAERQIPAGGRRALRLYS